MKKIGIIGAMEIEVETLKSHMQIKNTITKASMTFLEGTLNGVDVIIVRSGIGKVNAGICVQILVDLFEVTHIINTGVAGSLNAAIDIGDIVLSKIRFITMWMPPVSAILSERFRSSEHFHSLRIRR